MQIKMGPEKKRRYGFIVVGGIFFVLSIGLFARAQAQEEDGSDTGMDGAAQADENMSEREKLEWALEKLGVSRSILNNVRTMLEQARQEKDTIKITCLDDKGTQIHVSIQGVEERMEPFRIAVNAEDRVTSNQIFTILKIYFSRIFGLSAEAENCLGESDVVLGKTETTMLISGDVTVEDPSEEDIPDDFGVEQPTQLSGYF